MNTNQKIILIVVVVAVVFAGLVGSGAFLFCRYEKAKQAKEKEECLKHIKKIYALRSRYRSHDRCAPAIAELEVELGEVSSCRIQQGYYNGMSDNIYCELHDNYVH